MSSFEIVEPGYEVATPQGPDEGMRMLRLIERAARVCYRSEAKITDMSWEPLIKMLVKKKHTAMLEHDGYISVLFTCDRGVSHELVRHRIASFAQESTRYCNYGGKPVKVIQPPLERPSDRIHWRCSVSMACEQYQVLISGGVKPQMARSVLPTCTATQVFLSANPTEWRHIFRLRAAPDAHPQMYELMRPLLAELQARVPLLFDDIEVP